MELAYSKLILESLIAVRRLSKANCDLGLMGWISMMDEVAEKVGLAGSSTGGKGGGVRFDMAHEQAES